MAIALEVLPDVPELARAVAACVAGELRRAVAERGWCALALSGGQQLKAVYDELGLLQLPWEHAMFFFTDEKGVRPEHPASNYGLALDRLFSNPRIELHQVQRIEAEHADLEGEAERCAELLPEVCDVALLALEHDGALAGWFPGAGLADLAAEPREVVAVRAPRRPVQRITWTPRAFLRVGTAVVVASGAERREALARAGDPAEPSGLLPCAVSWWADEAASGPGAH